jgi:hypothetical protein
VCISPKFPLKSEKQEMDWATFENSLKKPLNESVFIVVHPGNIQLVNIQSTISEETINLIAKFDFCELPSYLTALLSAVQHFVQNDTLDFDVINVDRAQCGVVRINSKISLIIQDVTGKQSVIFSDKHRIYLFLDQLKKCITIALCSPATVALLERAANIVTTLTEEDQNSALAAWCSGSDPQKILENLCKVEKSAHFSRQCCLLNAEYIHTIYLIDKMTTIIQKPYAISGPSSTPSGSAGQKGAVK